jgi:hypothetical protein
MKSIFDLQRIYRSGDTTPEEPSRRVSAGLPRRLEQLRKEAMLALESLPRMNRRRSSLERTADDASSP